MDVLTDMSQEEGACGPVGWVHLLLGIKTCGGRAHAPILTHSLSPPLSPYTGSSGSNAYVSVVGMVIIWV